MDEQLNGRPEWHLHVLSETTEYDQSQRKTLGLGQLRAGQSVAGACASIRIPVSLSGPAARY